MVKSASLRSEVSTGSPRSIGADCLIDLDDNTWHADIFTAHSIGANAVSWAPAVVPGSLITSTQSGTTLAQAPQPIRQFASGGCDNTVKIWGYK
jgi:protein transport protein SEC13